MDANKDQSTDTLRAISENTLNTMAMKVTAMTYLHILKSFNVGQKRLYDLFVELAGYELDAYITKKDFAEYLKNKLNMCVAECEIDTFFRSIKQGSKDTDENRITATEYYMNAHAYPVDPMFKNALSVKIAALDPSVIAELDAWIKRINGILEDAKRANVFLMVTRIGLPNDRCRANLYSVWNRFYYTTTSKTV